MSTADWRRVREIFEAAADLPVDERPAFVRERCSGDDLLVAEVSSLLASDTAAATFAAALDRGAALPPPQSEALLGARIGPFAVERLLGSGGMGAVYAARQDEPRRTVALKVMALGLRSADALRRFRWESEVLARLRHPNVAQVYEVGVHRSGGLELPWFAMELVPDARDLLDWSSQQRLDVPQRLLLLLQVCEAVHHGHLHGVVHRDLKPQNLLVDGDGRVKVIDFGIARCSEVEDAGAARTASGMVLGTLRYMSPEQVAGGDVDLRTDVHALGVIAFELLAGRPPHDLDGLSPLTAAQAMLEREPLRLRAVRPDLDPDLDAIVGKAMARERELRYASVAAFADDVRAFLQHRPVQARPPSAIHQVRRFARRHRAFVAGSVAVVLALAIGLVAVLIQNRRIDRERAIAQRVSGFARGILAESSAMASRGVDYTVREALDEAVQRIDDEPWPEPAAEAEIRLLLGETYTGLSLPDEAQPHLERAVQLYGDVEGETGRTTIVAQMVLCLVWREQQQLERATAELARLHALSRRTFGADDELTLQIAHNEALLWREQSRFDDAERQYREVAAARERVLGASDPSTVATLHNLGNLLLAQRKVDAARDVLRDALERAREGRSDDDLSSLQIADNLAEVWRELGELDAAESMHRRAIAGFERLVGPDHVLTLGAGYHLLKVLFARQDFAALRVLATDLVARGERAFGAEDRRTLDLRVALGCALEGLGELQPAAAEFQRAYEINRRHLGGASEHTVTAGLRLAALRGTLEGPDATLGMTGELLESIGEAAQLPPLAGAQVRLLHAEALCALGRDAEARQHLAAVEPACATLPAEHPMRQRLAAARNSTGVR